MQDTNKTNIILVSAAIKEAILQNEREAIKREGS
jgi:hypothetical protein